MRFIVLAFFLTAVPLSAQAQPRPGATHALAGNWAFETDAATERRCTITGEATLTPARPDNYTVRLSTLEQCASGETWRSLQDCTAVHSQGSLRLSCTIVRVQPSNYAPDDFALRVVSADAMQGELVSTWNAPARWRRTRPDLVS
ncbi:MAG: hypothetical protein JNJ73_18000 [Hyphomonadaceae bacterium]|nr:hypothetical protein [Hyphomonadaceae bacterium]